MAEIVRAVHFAATVMACGAVFSYVLIAALAVREVRASPETVDLTRRSPLWRTLRFISAGSLCAALLPSVCCAIHQTQRAAFAVFIGARHDEDILNGHDDRRAPTASETVRARSRPKG